MATYVLLVRSAGAAAAGAPRRVGDYGEPIDSLLPVKWVASYASFAGCVDVVDAPDDKTAGQLGELLRWRGEDVIVLGWSRFRHLMRAVRTAASRKAVVARH